MVVISSSEQFCAEVLALAREARRHLLGVFHPTFNLLHCVRDILLEKLPADAHLKASGRLCVSLTRLADGKNLLVTHFHNRDELVQVLTGSIPVEFSCDSVVTQFIQLSLI